MEYKLDQILSELVPIPQAHHLHHRSHDDEERSQVLRYVMGINKDRIPSDEFAQIVKLWNIPSLEHDKQSEQEKDYVKALSSGRKLGTYWGWMVQNI